MQKTGVQLIGIWNIPKKSQKYSGSKTDFFFFISASIQDHVRKGQNFLALRIYIPTIFSIQKILRIFWYKWFYDQRYTIILPEILITIVIFSGIIFELARHAQTSLYRMMAARVSIPSNSREIILRWRLRSLRK